jgi:hypothetical protein
MVVVKLPLLYRLRLRDHAVDPIDLGQVHVAHGQIDRPDNAREERDRQAPLEALHEWVGRPTSARSASSAIDR